jgi:hypothetical protein
MELYLHYPNTPSRRGAQLKHRELKAVVVYHSLGKVKKMAKIPQLL